MTLEWYGGKPVIVGGKPALHEHCCCEKYTCSCCTGEVRGAVITLSGIAGDGGPLDAICAGLAGTYEVPVLDAGTGCTGYLQVLTSTWITLQWEICCDATYVWLAATASFFAPGVGDIWTAGVTPSCSLCDTVDTEHTKPHPCDELYAEGSVICDSWPNCDITGIKITANVY